jgi:hypothetical protein
MKTDDFEAIVRRFTRDMARSQNTQRVLEVTAAAINRSAQHDWDRGALAAHLLLALHTHMTENSK